jgi:protocatechuate 3,4-dioxygenase beta subunit
MHLSRRSLLALAALAPYGAARALVAQSEPFFRIAPPAERGTPIEIEGVVYAEDGTTPVPGARMFLYQTDDTGHYSEQRSGEPITVARIRAHASAGADGRYRFRTIKPGAYPGRPDARHIHVHLARPGVKDAELLDYRYSVREYLFADDPRLPEPERKRAEQLGRFSPVIKLTQGDDGIWRGVRDLRLGAK